MSRTHHHGTHEKDKNKLWDNWAVNEPKWWRKMMKHKKRRAELRRIIYQVMKAPYDDHIFPLNTKPWIYYW